MIREDTFPATLVVTAPDFETPVEELRSRPPTAGAASLPITRVVVTGDKILVLKDDVSGPQRVFEESIDPSTYHKGSIHVDSYVTTVTGKKLAWRKDSSCGCGSRLRSYRPFNTMGSSKDPGPEDA
ncbi:hypothetical protein SEA_PAULODIABOLI_75 [Microbacterium phage PauloDiaboli]|nr:hypothetical protein SEA_PAULODIABOLI_75 [Microbacterium phage PauloDiaboli]